MKQLTPRSAPRSPGGPARGERVHARAWVCVCVHMGVWVPDPSAASSLQCPRGGERLSPSCAAACREHGGAGWALAGGLGAGLVPGALPCGLALWGAKEGTLPLSPQDGWDSRREWPRGAPAAAYRHHRHSAVLQVGACPASPPALPPSAPAFSPPTFSLPCLSFPPIHSPAHRSSVPSAVQPSLAHPPPQP